jgi:glycosyltransferase involved in cell wall biosynthesis
VPHGSIKGVNVVLHRARIERALERIHSAHPIDVVEGPENGFSLAPRRSIAPRVIRMHGGHRFFTVTTGLRPRPWRSRLESRSFDRAQHICAVSRFVADTTRRLLRLGDRPIEVIPNPVDTDAFRFRPDVPEEDGLIVFVGAIREKKGALQLVLAMDEIVRAIPSAHLSLVGPDVVEPRYGGSFTRYLKSMVPASIAPRIAFSGPVPHAALAAVLARASVCVYPSHSEAMPLAWLEAMAAGKAVVASRTGPGPELVEDGTSGLLCDPHDPGSIADAVVRALRDPGLRQRLGREARRRAVECFSLDVLVARNERFYRGCLGG